jgi:hypothetical protein
VNKKLSDLEPINTNEIDTSGDLLYVVSDGESKKVTIGQLASAIIEEARFVRCPSCDQKNNFANEVCGYCGGRLDD